jgi:hypothetical protein
MLLADTSSLRWASLLEVLTERVLCIHVGGRLLVRRGWLEACWEGCDALLLPHPVHCSLLDCALGGRADEYSWYCVIVLGTAC